MTNSTLGQAVTGTVTGGSYALIILLKANTDGGAPFAGGFADAAGAFSISCQPGTYQAIAAKPGMLYNFGGAPSVTLTAGANANVNLALTASSQNFTGTLTNAASGGALPGVQMRAQSSAGLFAVSYTDAHGYYDIGLTPGQWTVELDEVALVSLGYVAPDQEVNVDTSGGVPAIPGIPVQPATALFYGNFREGGTLNGISAFPIGANLSGGNSSGRGLTDAAGYYTIGVVAGSWSIGPENNALTTRGILANSTNTTIADAQALRVDFLSRTVTAHLTGQVVDNFGVPLTNFPLVVQPVPFPPGGAGSYYPTTDATGNFDIGVSAGTWNIALESERTAASNLVSFSIDRPVVDNVNQSGLIFVAYRATQQITGFVRETNTTGITNVQLYAGATIGTTNYLAGAARTDANGNYQFGVINGSWTVQLNNQDLNQRGFISANSQVVPINNALGTANFSLTRFSNIITLGNLSRIGNQFSLQATADTGRTYVLEVTTNLRAPISWTPVTTNVQNGANFQATDNSATGSARYYRMRVLQP